MTSEFVVISSDDEPSYSFPKCETSVILLDDADSKEILYISSEDEKLSIDISPEDLFKPCRKMNELELPNIRFKSREARRLKKRHEIENKMSCKQSCINSETSRIPPLPDPSLFKSDSERNGNTSTEKVKSNTKKIPKSLKKKRQSIEAIKTKEREILGDLFALDKTSKVVKRNVPIKSSQSEKLTNKRPHSLNTAVVKDSAEEEKKSSAKALHKQNVYNKTFNFSGRSIRETKHSTRILHSSEKSCDRKIQSKAESSNSESIDNTTDCEIVRRLQEGTTEQILSDNVIKKVVNEVKRVAHVPVDDRHKTDCSDMCHHVDCSRTGPFELLVSLDRNYRKELENLKVSPRSENAVRFDKIPVVKLDTSRPLLSLNKKSKSVESSEGESDNEKGKRHFMDAFSDISEAESDSSIKPIIVEDYDYVGLNKTVHIDVDADDFDKSDRTLTLTSQEVTVDTDDVEDVPVIENVVDNNSLPSVANKNLKCLSFIETLKTARNYRMKVDEFSDISDNDSDNDILKQKKSLTEEHSISDTDENIYCVNTPLGGNDYLGNSTLSVMECDSDVIFVEKDIEKKVDTNMPRLERAVPDKSKSLMQSFEMPILEKYTEMYSSLCDGIGEQEVLPDIEEDSIDVVDVEIKKTENNNVPSTYFSPVNECRSNLFKNFTLFNDDSPDVSSFRPYTSKISSSTSSGLKHSSSDITLSGPKESSTPKSRKRKIHKSSTYLSSFASSSQLQKLTFTKQMDQLTVYMKDFLRLNDSKLTPPKLPDAQKNLVYGCEEDGFLNLTHALNFIEHFCQKNIIPSDLCKDVINSAFKSECSLSHIHWAYNLLSNLNTRRMADIEISWETIESCLNTALTASPGKPFYQLLQATLLLQLGIDVLKIDLFTRNLSDNRDIRKSFAYKMFAYDVSTGNRKSLIYFLNQALHAGQCHTVEEENKSYLPDVLPMLQDLLALCVDVSSSCIDCANILAVEMVNTYKFLPNLADKQLLIQSVSSQLLQCKLVQQVLESQYDCHQTLGSAFPDSLEDIIQCFFKVMPLKNPLTPPTSPNEDVFEREYNGEFSMFSPDVTEEIAMLLYFIVVSYLQASSEKMYMALRLRVNVPEAKKRLRSDDELELSKMHKHVHDLELHLRCMNANLTENTEHCLFLMKCMGDLVKEQ